MEGSRWHAITSVTISGTTVLNAAGTLTIENDLRLKPASSAVAEIRLEAPDPTITLH